MHPLEKFTSLNMPQGPGSPSKRGDLGASMLMFSIRIRSVTEPQRPLAPVGEAIQRQDDALEYLSLR
jgi:hypothetical protein